MYSATEMLRLGSKQQPEQLEQPKLDYYLARSFESGLELDFYWVNSSSLLF